MSTPAPRPTEQERRFGAGRIVLIAVGCIAALMALALFAGAGFITWANATQRDADGFFATTYHRYSTPSFALTREHVRVFTGVDRPEWITRPGRLATVRVSAHAIPGRQLFVGIARTSAVDAYLGGVAHDEVTDVSYDPFSVNYRSSTGTAPMTRPGNLHVWSVQATGAAPAVTWPVRKGNWSLVVMNASGAQGVSADVRLAAKVNFLGWVSLGLFLAGVLFAAAAALMIAFGVRRRSAATGAAGAGATAARYAAEPSPVVLDATPAPALSRWLWLVKWLLLIPHIIVLAFLWCAFFVLTIVAGVAILFTGRYPRGIFDFNVGVLRWTWRVAYYSYAALGTDRYPPFTLADVPDYPARLDVAYPERLSHWLVLVKWWLLALPQLVIVGILLGTAWGPRYTQFGLIAVLVVVAGFCLLFAGRYPAGLYDFLMGLNRWVVRVGAYVALMTDRYPPFRLDQGAHEPRARRPAVG